MTAWMARALELARRGIALAHPNPMVGAVLVKSGRVIGEGFHVYDNRDHAEIVALKQAGEKARGATLYVTLEPCCTTGRTGPCTKAIIAAGVKRVVAAMKDPNPAVAGRGFAELKRAGIEVHVGIGDEAAPSVERRFREMDSHRAAVCDSENRADARRPDRRAPGSIHVDYGRSLARGRSAHSPRCRRACSLESAPCWPMIRCMTDRTGEPRRRRLLRAVVDSRLRLPLKSTAGEDRLKAM